MASLVTLIGAVTIGVVGGSHHVSVLETALVCLTWSALVTFIEKRTE